MKILLSRENIETEYAVLFSCPLLRRHDSTDTTAWLRQFDAEELEQFGDKPRIVLARGLFSYWKSSNSSVEQEKNVDLRLESGMSNGDFTTLLQEMLHAGKIRHDRTGIKISIVGE